MGAVWLYETVTTRSLIRGFLDYVPFGLFARNDVRRNNETTYFMAAVAYFVTAAILSRSLLLY